MASKYVTPAGLKIPSVEDLLNEIAADQRFAIDPLLNTDPDSPIGQINGPFASQLREVWEVVNIAFHGMDPGAAEGALLDYLSAITGTKREAPKTSKFRGSRKLKVNLSANKTVPVGTAFHVDGDSTIQFVTTEEVNSTVAGDYFVAAESSKTGPVRCNAHTLTVITNPVVGLNSVDNPYDAEIGADIELDPGLRVRRESELRATGSSNPDAIRADILSISIEGDQPVLACTVLSNDSDLFANGLPPHSLEAVVFDGLSQAVPNDTIAQTLFDSKAGGIQAVGNTSGVAVDDLGGKHTVKFSRPAVKEIAFQITLSPDLDTYAGDDAVKAAILDTFAGEMVNSGVRVTCSRYVGAIMALAGVTDVSGVQVTINGQAFPAPFTNLQLGDREIGNSQSSWISIVKV